MLNRVSSVDLSSKKFGLYSKSNSKKVQNNATNSVSFGGNYKSVPINKLTNAYIGYNGVKFASTVSFTGGGSLYYAFEELNKSMATCKDEAHGMKGEVVGSRIPVSELLARFKDDLPRVDDTIKTTIEIARNNDEVTEARMGIKKDEGRNTTFEMNVRNQRPISKIASNLSDTKQNIKITLQPYGIEYDANHNRYIKGTEESAYVLNTKGNLMAVVEDGDNVLLTDTGTLIKKDVKDGALNIRATKDKNVFRPFEVKDNPVVTSKKGGSQGGGTELVIGLEDGRFVPEIIDSISTFCEKVNNGEIVLDEFKPAKNADKMQIAMLAGGFGSRAEYTNASSSRIFHNKKNGSNLTKGCFRTATGLTPMETTFISLHKAGLLDCSKGNIGIGKNIKFYLNDSGINGGNGGFTVDMYDTMARDNRKSLLILPNDAMSRIPVSLNKMNEIMNSGKAAVVMVAKEVDKEDARGSLGIMKINKDGEIEAFAEKPKEFEEGYVDKNGKCFANTFQFVVSKEAFDVLKYLEDYLPSNSSGKEPRDWSKTFTPILMAITRNDDFEKMQKEIEKATKVKIDKSALSVAKDILGDQKIYAVKSSEPWADCGTLNALYHTTMQIASGEFPLEDFERKRVLDSVNTETGLVASSPEQKMEIESKYDIDGQIMAVPKAKEVSPDIVDKYEDAIVKYSDKH